MAQSKHLNFNQQEIFLRPMCLIATDEDGKMEVEKDSLAQIKKVSVPIVAVSIVGLYRTGKSYLMNRLAGVSEGFPLGSSIMAKTKGIWAWCKMHPKIPNTVLLLLDTEGLGDVDKGDICHDNRIFTLAVLLCNVLVYNMMTVFNHDAVEKLTFISEISKNIRFKNRRFDTKETDQLDMILPQFVLCLRDFNLDLTIDNEKELTPDEYLEYTLRLKPGQSQDVINSNRTKESIRKYFPNRKCFTFDAPGNRTVIKMLDKMALDQLNDTFQQDTEKFLQYMYDCKPKVLILSKPVNGEMFTSLVETYVKAVREGEVPDVDDAMMSVANIENERLSDSLVQQFRHHLDQAQLPQLNTKDFDELYHRYKEDTLVVFRTESMFDAEKFELRLIDTLDKMYREKKDKNMELVKKHCNEELEKIYKELVGDQPDKYHHAGGYSEYKMNIGKVKAAFKKNLINTDESTVQDVMNTFLSNEQEVEHQIMFADHKLSEDERKREIDRIQKEHAEAQKQQKEEFERQRQEDQKRNEEHMKRIEDEKKEFKKHEEEMQKMFMEEWKKRRDITENQIKIMMSEDNKAREEDLRRLHDQLKQDRLEQKLEREKEKRKRAEKKAEREKSCSVM